MAKEGLGLDITELRLGLPGGEACSKDKNEKKRLFSEICGETNSSISNTMDDDHEAQSKKKQVIGWPPVCSYRRKNGHGGNERAKLMYVKVKMDGAPFIRKIDFGIYKGYSDFVMALEKLFCHFGICEALKNTNNSEYVLIYEDKDGDWMRVGDVPWLMFTESCKRLRIMKRSDGKCIGSSCEKLS